MKAPSLQKTTALSAFLHLTLFLVAAIVLRQSNHVNLPSPYIVDLVSPAGRSVAAPRHHTPRTLARKSIPEKRAIQTKHDVERLKKRERIDEARVEDRIAELAAKERIKDIGKLREVISIPSKGQESEAKQASQPQPVGKAAGQGGGGGSYTDKITGEIWKQWSYPDTGEKNLEAVISVLILKDGTIRVQNFDKRSGNTFFDRSALLALKNASPVTPPPNMTEMEIGIRFFL